MKLDTNPDLLQGFREGRRDVLERVYRENVRAVDGYLRKLARASGQRCLAQPGAVADLTQEIFVRAFSATARRHYDGIRDFLPYLLTIARNCFADAHRASGREVPQATEELTRMVEQEPEVVEPTVDARTLTLLNDYLRHLPTALLGVYEQRFVLGNSQESSSAALGMSRRALRTAEARLQTGVRKALLRAGVPSEI